MCREVITPDQEAYEYDGCVFCTVDCAAEQYRRDAANSMFPVRFASEREYEDDIAASIKELTPFDIVARANGLRCGDRLRPVAKTMGTMINAAS